MGLDMYLHAKRYIGHWDHSPAEEREQAQAAGKLVGIDPLPGNSVTISVHVAYWRKANAIHEWFVANCQDGVEDCRESHVSEEQLKTLIDLCRASLANESGAKEHLPTKSGFFFGSTEYGDEYKADLQDTIDQLTPLLTDPKWERFEFAYRSSW